ncbi:hypothetical protein NUW58_g713 [Xylaria curta]|uniref:Uncharacterized protein n=1 Tax=Xylaria curta TaxID=42375 RepID=A0ACC1PR71_9PEZI|nr:hypothetical protein NUW58_g713 [Xylaria curta]
MEGSDPRVIGSFSFPAESSHPAGDIGNHILPEAAVVCAGILAFSATTTRLFARYTIRMLDVPDILLAFFLFYLYNEYEAGIYPGLGVHTWEYNHDLAKASHYDYRLGSILFAIIVLLLKAAILLDWKHIFVPRTRNTLSWVLVTMIWANCLFYCVGILIEVVGCSTDYDGKVNCKIDLAMYTIASGIINVVSDLIILITPHWVVWKLNMPNAQKMGVSVLFLIGFFATSSALARVVYIVKGLQTTDFVYYIAEGNLWAVSELTFGYLVIGVPSIPKALHGLSCTKYFGSVVTSRTGPPSHPASYYSGRPTWPGFTSRRNRDPTEEGGQEAYGLVTMLNEEEGNIPPPPRAQSRAGRE